MKTQGKVFLLILASIAAAAAYGQVNPPSLLKLLQEARALTQANKIFSKIPAACAASGVCRVNATVTELFDRQNNLVACVVRADNINLTYGSHPGPRAHIMIAWTLVPPTPATPPTNATYKFERPHGVIITRDDGPSSRGRADSITDTEVQLDHRFVHHGDETHFYPGVIQTLPDKTESLCFAGDPRITND